MAEALTPPVPRSRKAIAFATFAARGELMLQHCAECGAIAYPFREACPKCLSVDLRWAPVPDRARLIAATTIRVSPQPYFAQHLPWRTGTVSLGEGVSILAHLHGQVKPGDDVRLIARTDKAGNGAIIAMPREETASLMEDPQLREFSCAPAGRRILVTDGTSPLGQAIAHALLDAGAAAVVLGIPGGAAIDARLAGRAGVETVALDVTDPASVASAAIAVGAAFDILVNTAVDAGDGRAAMEVNYFGLTNLIDVFGQELRCAWVNPLSAGGLGSSASFAAAHAALLGLRGDLAARGARTLLVWSGALDAGSAKPIAQKVVHALEQGLEEAAVGAAAEDVLSRWRADPALFLREVSRQESRS